MAKIKGDSNAKKATDKKPGSRKVLIIVSAVLLLGGGGLLGCISCGVGTYLLWPAGNAKNNAGNGELLAYVSPDANLLKGGRPKELVAKFPALRESASYFDMRVPIDTFPEFERLVFNCERYLIFEKMGNVALGDARPRAVMVFKAEEEDIDRLRKSDRLFPAKQVGGHSIHKIKNALRGFGGGPDLLAINGKDVLVSDLDEMTFTTVLDRREKPPAKSQAIELSRSLDRSLMWTAFMTEGKRVDDVPSFEIHRLTEEFKQFGVGPADINGLVISKEEEGANDLKSSMKCMCKDATAANRIKTGYEGRLAVLRNGMNMMPNNPGNQMLRDILNMSISVSGTDVNTRVTHSKQSIEEMVATLKKQFSFGGGGNNAGLAPQGVIPFGAKILKSGICSEMHKGQSYETTFKLQGGEKIELCVRCIILKGAASAEISILEGDVGENIVFSDKRADRQRQTSFTAPRNSVYRVRLTNAGPGGMDMCSFWAWQP